MRKKLHVINTRIIIYQLRMQAHCPISLCDPMAGTHGQHTVVAAMSFTISVSLMININVFNSCLSASQ